MKSHALFGCICVLGMLRGVTSRSLPDISEGDVASNSSILISTNNRYYEYSEGEQMSFNCTMEGGDERKANITFAIDGDQKKELFGVHHVTIKKDAEATDNQQYLYCDIWYKGNLSQATKLITVYYSPRVAAEDLDVNGTYIATGDFKVGQVANLTVRFRANPRSYLAEWTVNGKKLDANRFTPLTPDKFSFENGFWVAVLRIEKFEESDLNDKFQLHVVNEHGSTTILIRMKGNMQPLPDISNFWLHILVPVVVLVVVAVGLSIVNFLCTKNPHSTSNGNSVEDIQMIHQSTTSDPYILQGVKNQEQICRSCYDLANEVSSSKILIAIVEGVSGMGKTQCLKEIRDHFVRTKPKWRVVNLNMRIFRDDFASKLSSTYEAVSLVASKLDLSNEERRVFEDRAKAELVLYLFDDIDCIENLKLEVVLQFFELLQKVIATTRNPFIVKQPYVEKYSLQPLDDAQQGKLMEKLGCSKSMGQEIKTLKRDFDLGVPLYLLMTAQNALLMNAELPEELVLTNIYSCFMENRVQKVLREKNETHTKNDMEVILHNLAISFAFHEESKQEDELSIRDLALTCVINKRTYFTNSAIVEYLTASALVKKLKEVPESAKILLPTRNLSKLLVSDEFSTERYLANKIISHSSTIPIDCSNFLEDLECDNSELATTIIKERLFSLHKELARNGLRLDFDQRLQLGKGKKTFPLIWAAMEAASDSEISSTSFELFRFLTESGVCLDRVDEKGDTALSIAIKTSNEPLVKFLLELGATMKLVHNCCLHLAAETGNLPLVEFFSSHYEVDMLNVEGVTPLMLAAFKGNLQVVQFLISKGSNVNLEAANGSTSLHYAAQGGHVEVLKVLVTKENIDILNSNLETPLMFSLKEKQLETVKYLLSAGADATKVDKKQNSCLHLAAENGWLDFMRLLSEDEKIKTLLNLPNRDGRIALHLAALIGHAETVRYLLDKGADPDKKDKDGNTPYMLATARGHTNIAKIIPVKNDDNKGKSSLLGKR